MLGFRFDETVGDIGHFNSIHFRLRFQPTTATFLLPVWLQRIAVIG
jgi:hypothetical protein